MHARTGAVVFMIADHDMGVVEIGDRLVVFDHRFDTTFQFRQIDIRFFREDKEKTVPHVGMLKAEDIAFLETKLDQIFSRMRHPPEGDRLKDDVADLSLIHI